MSIPLELRIFNLKDNIKEGQSNTNMLSIGPQSTSSKQTLRVVDKNRLIEQRVRVKPDEKLIFKSIEESMPQENLWDLSNDYIYQNSNDDLLDLGNSQMSSFFREFTESKNNAWKEEKNTPSNYFKSIKGSGFYFCGSCPFLCLNVKLFLEHSTKDHNVHLDPLKSLLRTKCVGCENIFYSVNVLRVSIFIFLIIYYVVVRQTTIIIFDYLLCHFHNMSILPNNWFTVFDKSLGIG